MLGDVYWDDVDVAGVTSSGGFMFFNSYYLDSFVDSQKLNLCMHEFGHALGLDHNTENDVMYAYVKYLTILSANDKASYDAAAKKY